MWVPVGDDNACDRAPSRAEAISVGSWGRGAALRSRQDLELGDDGSQPRRCLEPYQFLPVAERPW
ncbi:MAG: hypothetical protein ACYCYK_04595 [Candidatus Dormibacteria bacterium]